MESRLLASSDSLDGIVSLIERFWYAKPNTIALCQLLNENIFQVYQNGKVMEHFRVLKKKNRFRFEYSEK